METNLKYFKVTYDHMVNEWSEEGEGQNVNIYECDTTVTASTALDAIDVANESLGYEKINRKDLYIDEDDGAWLSYSMIVDANNNEDAEGKYINTYIISVYEIKLVNLQDALDETA